MNPEVQAAINNINQYIVENHNNEITANILNPILIELANLFDLVGDLSELNTTDKDSVVDAINEAISLIAPGAQIHTGTADPNVTPPATYAVGDLYSRLTIGGGDPYQIYMFNGVEWGEIKRFINDAITSNEYSWSSQKISDAILGDRLLNSPTIVIDGTDITISDLQWVINGNTYILSPAFIDTIPYTSEAGKVRTDIIVGIQANELLRIQGVEGDVAVSPTVPANTVLVTTIDVFDDSIGTPTEPIVGIVFIKKTNWIDVASSGGDAVLTSSNEDLRHFVIKGYSETGGVTGLSLISFENNPSYQGQEVIIDNDTEFEIPLLHNFNDNNGAFTFPNEEDYIFKPKERVIFNIKQNKISFSSTNMATAGGSGDFIPLSGTEVGKPLTGNIEVDTSDDLVGFYSNQGGVERRIAMTDDGFNTIRISNDDYASIFEQDIDIISFGLYDLNTNEISEIKNHSQYTTITTVDADGNKAEIEVGAGGTVRFNSDMPDDNFDGQLYYNAEEGLRIKDNNSNDESGLGFAGVGGQHNSNNWEITKQNTDTTSSNLLLPDSGATPRRIPVSVNGNFADQQGDIELSAVDIDYDNAASGLLAETVQEAVDEIVENISKAGFVQRTGSVIAFDEWAIYGSYDSPSSGNLSYSFTDAIVGCVQVLYHEDTITPTFSQVGLDVDVDELEYQPSVVNEIIIFYRQPNKIRISITPL